MKFTKHNLHNLFKQESYQVPTFYHNNFIRHLKTKHLNIMYNTFLCLNLVDYKKNQIVNKFPT